MGRESIHRVTAAIPAARALPARLRVRVLTADYVCGVAQRTCTPCWTTFPPRRLDGDGRAALEGVRLESRCALRPAARGSHRQRRVQAPHRALHDLRVV